MSTRKLYLAGLFSLILSAFACEISDHPPPPPPPPSTGEEGFNPGFSNVVYSPDGKSLTLWLDGSVFPAGGAQSRALSRELAIAGHDYFEVVFQSYSPAKTVRASWELYAQANVVGLERGVNYGRVTAAPPASPAGQGAAIIFVGKKTDKTLLAVGRISATDDGGAGVTTVTNSTRAVTFTITALETGVMYRNQPTDVDTTNITVPGFQQSSFFTSYRASGDVVSAQNTRTDRVFIPPVNGKEFPQFRLKENAVTNGEYYFRLAGGGDLGPANFTPGIILAGNGSYGKKQPRYPMADGKFQYSALRLDDRTKIKALNNIADADPETLPDYDPLANPMFFENPVRVSFDTNNTVTGSAFAFVFEIPVYPLSAVPSFDSTPAGTWYVRASYDSYWLDLDDGVLVTRAASPLALSGSQRAGGAVLMGTGDGDATIQLQIRVAIPPMKYIYNGNPIIQNPYVPNLNTGGRDFNVDGIVVRLETLSGTLVKVLTRSELEFELGMKNIRPNSEGYRNGEALSKWLYGLQVITVKYTEGDSLITYTDTFLIVCDSVRDNGVTENFVFTDIDDGHIYATDANAIAWDQVRSNIQNMVAANRKPAVPPATQPSGAGTYVVIFDGSIDFMAINFQQQDIPLFFILVAASANGGPDPNVRIGRNANTAGARPNPSTEYGGSGGVFINWSNHNGYYLGKWPFQTPLVKGGVTYHHAEEVIDGVINQYSTYGYTLNAAGLISEIVGNPPNATEHGYYAPFFSSGQPNGRIYSVNVDKSVIIVPQGTEQLY